MHSDQMVWIPGEPARPTGTSHAGTQGLRAAMLHRCNGNSRGVLHIPGGSEDSMSGPLAVFLAATLLASGAAPLAAGAPARLHRQQAEGRVIGRVVDARTNAPLSSVRVYVVGTQIGVITNADGRDELPGAAAGTDDVRAPRIGYRPSTQTLGAS